MRIAVRIPFGAVRMLVRHKCLALIAIVAALFILPFALSRDPEICVLNAIGLAYVLFQLRVVICTLGIGRAMAARRQRVSQVSTQVKEGARNDNGNDADRRETDGGAGAAGGQADSGHLW